jgi:chemotaxis regulatin CheY-phosphate phosphatase CheZ
MHLEEVNAFLLRADEVVASLNNTPESQAFIADVFGFLRHILPVIGELQKSIAQTSEKLPTASRQLDKVTEANEIASTEILDTVERIMSKALALQTSGSGGGNPGWKSELDEIQSDCTGIMMALQVQDITAQQIAAVNRLMQSVDEGLNELLQHIRGVKGQSNSSEFKQQHITKSYDPNADFFGSADKQRVADDLIAQHAGPVQGSNTPGPDGVNR